MPADGPSFGVAPAGRGRENRRSQIVWVDFENLRMGTDVAQGGLHALAHDLTQGAGQNEMASAGHLGGLDEKNVAADAGPGQAVSGDAAFDALFDGFVEKFGRPEESL